MVEPDEVYLTSNQIEVIETLKRFDGDIGLTAMDLNKTEQNIYNILFNIRKSRKKAQLTVNTVNNWMKEPSLRKHLF